MTDKVKVKKSVSRYLWRQSEQRDRLRRTLEGIAERLDDTFIFGGMIREFGLGNSRAFNSDIDVVSLSSRSEIFSAIKEYSPRMNKFGGYRFFVNKQLFDIWSFEDTWAFKNGLVEGKSSEDIFKTTFFNLDAAAFHLKAKKFSCAENYISALRSRLLDLNLEENPSPSGMVRRAIKMAIENELSVTRRLGEYILSNANAKELDFFANSFVRALDQFLSSSECEAFSFSPQRCLFEDLDKHAVIEERLVDELFSN